LWHFDVGETVESFDSPDGGFRIHYTRAGRNATVAGDANDSGVPDFVEQVASVYDEVGSYYANTLGYHRPLSDVAQPDNGGDGRFDVYLVDFNHQSDGAFQLDDCPAPNPDTCVGYVVQENDFAGYSYPSPVVATRILGSHEYFHAVQSAYDKGQGSVLDEGTAEWASAQFDPALRDMEGFFYGYLDSPGRSLDTPPPGPVPAFSYGASLFFQFLKERYDRPLVRKLWERCENGHGLTGDGDNPADPYWVPQLDLSLKADYASSFEAAFLQFAQWNLYTGPVANPAKGYLDGSNYPQPAMVTVALPYKDPKLRAYYASTQYYQASPGGRATMTAALVDPGSPAPTELTGVSLVLAVRRGAAWSEVTVLADAAAGTQTADTSGASSVVVAVVNANRAGPSKRPGLCLGTAAEVVTCRAAVLAPDAGVPTISPGQACEFGKTFCIGPEFVCTGGAGEATACVPGCQSQADCVSPQTCEPGQNSLRYCRSPPVTLPAASAEGPAAPSCAQAGAAPVGVVLVLAAALALARRRRAS
jgi:hypothetical protein